MFRCADKARRNSKCKREQQKGNGIPSVPTTCVSKSMQTKDKRIDAKNILFFSDEKL